MQPTEYNIDKTLQLIQELDKLMATNPKLDPLSSDLIIRNLIAGLKNTVRQIKFLKDQLDMEVRVRLSIAGRTSDAKN